MPTLQRLNSIDLMRGLVIALMALDHTRDFFSNALISPTDLNQTTPALFLTRWITHLCAPTFVFLAGSSAYLTVERHNMSRQRLAGYLLSRGFWLVFLEFTVVHFGWTFNWDLHYVIGQVIWVLGWSMVVLAGLIFLPRWSIMLFALITITGHNFFDRIQSADLQPWGWLWTFLHVRGSIGFLPGYSLFVLYPLIPWVGVMAAGYCFGKVFLLPESKRKFMLWFMVFFCISTFLILRLPNIYGDPQPWTPQKDWLFTVFSMLNFEKYPPSLLYLLMTLGIMMLGLVLFESKHSQRFGRALIIFGRVPMFFYVIHLLVIHSAMLIITWLRGFPIDWLYPLSFPKIPSADYGYDLAAVYGFWLVLLLLLYPLCYAYAGLRQRYPDNRWLSYL